MTTTQIAAFVLGWGFGAAVLAAWEFRRDLSCWLRHKSWVVRGGRRRVAADPAWPRTRRLRVVLWKRGAATTIELTVGADVPVPEKVVLPAVSRFRLGPNEDADLFDLIASSPRFDQEVYLLRYVRADGVAVYMHDADVAALDDAHGRAAR